MLEELMRRGGGQMWVFDSSLAVCLCVGILFGGQMGCITALPGQGSGPDRTCRQLRVLSHFAVLEVLLGSVLTGDSKVLWGDFNTHVGNDSM